MKLFRTLAFACALASFAFVAPGNAVSTVNPVVPAANSPLSSAVVRNNFAATYTDINNILGKFAGTVAPTNQTALQDWVDTSGGAIYKFNFWNPTTGTWVQWGSLNSTTGVFAVNPTSTAFAKTAPITLNISGGVATYGLAFDANFTAVSGSLAFAPAPAGDLLANCTSFSAEPGQCTWNSFANQAISNTNGALPYRTGGAWGSISTGLGGNTIPLNNTANVFSAAQSIITNAAAFPTPDAGALLSLGNLDGVATRIELTSAGASAVISGRTALGTLAAPTTLTSGTLMMSYNAHGYDGTSWATSASGAVHIYAEGTWSNTSHPTEVCDATTPVSSTTISDVLCIHNDTGVTVGSPTGGDKGSGTFNATAVYQAGNQVTSSATTPLVLTVGVLTCPTCVTGTSGALTASATPTSGYTSGQILGSTGSVLSAYSVSGTGNVALVGSPAFTGTPTAPTQAIGDTSTALATDAFVANAINAQVDMKDPVQAATTAALIFSPTYANGSSGVGATLTATVVGVLIIDGYTPALGDRLLIKNQASTFQNGCYTVTTLGVIGTIDYVLTRCSDYNQTTEIVFGTTFPVLQGSTNVNQQFTMNNNAAITVGTTAITYAQTSGGSQLQAGTGITITGNTVSGTLGTNSSPGIVQCDGSTINCSGGIITSIGSTPVGLVPTPPQGRITLVSGVAVPTTDQVGIAFHIYTPAPGQYLPITTNGTTFTMTQFFESSQATTDTAKSPAAVAANSVYDIFGWLDSATTTVTIASPAVLSWTGNGFRANAEFSCTTTGTFPTGMSANTPYYVITTGLGANSFEFAASVGGSAINTTGSQSGTMTCSTIRASRGPAWTSDTNPGTGAGTSQRNFATAFPTNAFAITNGPGANKGTLLGSCRSNGSSLFVDSQLFRWCSNIYNTQHRYMYAGDSATSWTYNTATSGLFEQAHNLATNEIDFLQSVSGGMLHATTNDNSSNSGTGTITVDGIGIGQVTVNNAQTCSGQNSPVANAVLPITCSYDGYPGLGRTFAAWLEYSPNTGTSTFYGNGLSPGILLYGISGWIDN